MKWEYTYSEATDHKQHVEAANALGAERWELVHIHETVGFLVGFYKRPVSSAPAAP